MKNLGEECKMVVIGGGLERRGVLARREEMKWSARGRGIGGGVWNGVVVYKRRIRWKEKRRKRGSYY